jgi:hypothetical protein
VTEIKKIEAKIKKEEKEERNLARLIQGDFDEIRNPLSYLNGNPNQPHLTNKKLSGAMLLSRRFKAKLPVPDSLQLRVSSALSALKIKPDELHHSKKVLAEFDSLREQMLILFAVDKYI